MKPGTRARIISITVAGSLRRRLMDMGVLVGEEIALTKVAPMGDPLEISVKDYSLSLRKNEAAAIGVEVLGD
jgi:ferrous iron transport protein A